MVRPETNVRLTDILGDKVLSRLGNVGNELLADLLDKFHSALGMPFEIIPTNPYSAAINISSGVYILPDGRRIAPMRNGTIPTITSVNIDFSSGTISGGTNPSFTLPSMTVDYHVKALVQYSYGKNAFQITFGPESDDILTAGSPTILIDYEPIGLLELHSTNGGVGDFDPIGRGNVIAILDSMDYEPEPQEEIQTTSSSQTEFDLSIITIPSSRSRLMVFLNGVYQKLGTHYNVTSDTKVTFTQPISALAEVIFRVM